jgi:type I restriction enzyme M protein
MEQPDLNWIANFVWGIADDVLCDLYVRAKYRDVILPMAVLRRLDAVLDARTWLARARSTRRR